MKIIVILSCVLLFTIVSIGEDKVEPTEDIFERYAKVLNENILLKQKLEKLKPESAKPIKHVNTKIKMLRTKDVVNMWKDRRVASKNNPIQAMQLRNETNKRFVDQLFRFSNAIVLRVCSVAANRKEFAIEVLLPTTNRTVKKSFLDKSPTDISWNMDNLAGLYKQKDCDVPQQILIKLTAGIRSKKLFGSLLRGNKVSGHGVITNIVFQEVYEYSRTREKKKRIAAVYSFNMNTGKRTLVSPAKTDIVTELITWKNPVIAVMRVEDCIVTKGY